MQKLEFVKEPQDVKSIEGNAVTFECSALAMPTTKLNYLWKKDGKYIDMAETSRISVSSAGNLLINSIKTGDFGVYQCVAMCEYGAIISQPAKLEKPGNSKRACIKLCRY